MSSRSEHFYDSNHERNQKRTHEEIRWDHEESARFADSTQIHERNEQQDDEAKRQRVGLERGDSGDQRADARGNSHRGRQNVIDHERSGCKQPRERSQVLTGYSVGTTPVWVGFDRLPIGEVNDYQQDNYADRNWNDVGNSRRTERD